MQMDDMILVSIDDHMIEPPDMYKNHLPAKWLDQAPKIVRNAQGIDWDPKTGMQYQTEHGPSGFDGPGGGDEVNLVEKGKNYGWPVVHHRESAAGMVSPLLEYTPAVAPSGASFATGDALPSFKGDFFFATLRGERLIRVRFGPVELGRGIRSAGWRELEAHEIRELQRAVGLP